MMTTIAAITYAALGTFPAVVQVALALGAPWGALALGGRWPGQLPPRIRGLAVIQALMLVVMMLVVLAHASMVDLAVPKWAIWPVIAVNLLSMVANLATPSVWERRLWGPVTVVMLVAALVVAVTAP